jgi:RecA/RadA recombinase
VTEAKAPNLAQLIRQNLNEEAAAAHSKLTPKQRKEQMVGEKFKEVAMDPATADELSAFNEFIEMRDYFNTAVGVPGWPCGGISQIIGKSDSGKTTMLIEGMVSTQKAGGLVYMIDSEHKFPWERFEDMGGIASEVVVLPVDSLEDAWNSWWMIAQQVKRIREEGIFSIKTGEKKGGKDVMMEVPVPKDIKVMAAWDSVAASVANAILNEDHAGKQHVAIEAKINNKEVRKLKKIVKLSKIAAVFINHSYMSMPMMGPPEEIVKGGEEMYYMSSLILKLVKGKKIERDVTVDGEKFKQKIGRESKLEVFKGHLSGRATIMKMNVCAPGMLNKDELDEYRKSIQGQL